MNNKFELIFDKTVHGIKSGWQGFVYIMFGDVQVYSFHNKGSNIDAEWKIVQGLFTLQYMMDTCSDDETKFNRIKKKTIKGVRKHKWNEFPIGVGDSLWDMLGYTILNQVYDGSAYDWTTFDLDRFISDKFVL